MRLTRREYPVFLREYARAWLAKSCDKAEAGSFIFERFVYRSLDKAPARTQDALTDTVGMAAKHTGHAARAVINKVWKRWGW